VEEGKITEEKKRLEIAECLMCHVFVSCVLECVGKRDFLQIGEVEEGVRCVGTASVSERMYYATNPYEEWFELYSTYQ
jgi:hypothetical protein